MQLLQKIQWGFEYLFSAAGLDAAGIAQSIEQRLSLLKLPNQATQ